jgi:hypothetical protein
MQLPKAPNGLNMELYAQGGKIFPEMENEERDKSAYLIIVDVEPRGANCIQGGDGRGDARHSGESKGV